MSLGEWCGLSTPVCPPPLQDESTAEITFYMKGADAVMATVVQYNDWLEEEVTAALGAGTQADEPAEQTGQRPLPRETLVPGVNHDADLRPVVGHGIAAEVC